MFSEKLSESRLVVHALRNAAGAYLYIVFIGWLMYRGERLFGPLPGATGLMVGLSLFVVSALIEAALVLGEPIWLVVQDKKREALHLFGYTTGAMILVLLLVMLVSAYSR